MKETQLSVNCIVQYKNEVLLIKRSSQKDIDPNVINVLGGKVNKGENFVDAAIREAREETGDIDGSYIKEKVEYCGTFIFDGGFEKNWVSQFYKFYVNSRNCPGNLETQEGKLFWVSINKIFELENLIWDLKYCFGEILDDKLTFQINATLDDNLCLVGLNKTTINEDGFVQYKERFEPEKPLRLYR